MSEPTVIPSGGGEIIGDSAERRVEILSDGKPPPSAHGRSIFVLEGELTVGDRDLRAPTGAWVNLPPGLPLTVSARGPVRYLEITPSRG